jgi:adenine deaminase
MKVTLGKEKTDLALINATIVNVYTGELLEAYSVGIKGEWIAFAGHDSEDTIGPYTHVIDPTRKTIIPGLIDGHNHIVWLYSAGELLCYAMVGSTKTIITEIIELFYTVGYKEVVDFPGSPERDRDSIEPWIKKLFGRTF